MFVMCGALAVLVVLLLGDETIGTNTHRWFEHLADNAARGWIGHFSFLQWLVLGIAAAGLRLHLRELRGTVGVVATVLTGMLCAFGLAVALHEVGVQLCSLVQHEVMEHEQGPIAA